MYTKKSSSNTGGQMKDIQIPAKFKDFTPFIKERHVSEFLIYLNEPSVCPYSPQIRETLTIKKIQTAELNKCLEAIFNMLKTQPNVFIPIPVYIISYVCAIISSLIDKKWVSGAIEFISKMINLRHHDMSEEILDILLPTFLFNTAIDDPPVRANFVISLTDTFGVNNMLPHLFDFYDSVARTMSLLTRFNINILIKIVETFAINLDNLNRAKAFAESQVNSQNQETISILLQTLDECEVDENAEMTTPKSGRKTPRSVSSYRAGAPSITAPSIKSVSPEVLDQLLDSIENGEYKSEMELINDIRSQMERLKQFPVYRKIDPLFKFAMKTYANKKIKPEQQKMIYLLMTNVNNLCNPARLLDLYLEYKDNETCNHDFLEQCYQHFLKTSPAKNKLPRNVNIPVSLVASSDLNPRRDIEFAFTCLNDWKTSYDGVKRIWELLKAEPDADVTEYFDPLIFTEKTFLVEGLRNCMENEGETPEMKKVIDELDDRMMNETKSDRVNREAQEVSNKMNELINTEKSNIPYSSSAADKIALSKEKENLKYTEQLTMINNSQMSKNSMNSEAKSGRTPDKKKKAVGKTDSTGSMSSLGRSPFFNQKSSSASRGSKLRRSNF